MGKYGGRRQQLSIRFDKLERIKLVNDGNAKELERFAEVLDITIVHLKE